MNRTSRASDGHNIFQKIKHILSPEELSPKRQLTAHQKGNETIRFWISILVPLIVALFCLFLQFYQANKNSQTDKRLLILENRMLEFYEDLSDVENRISDIQENIEYIQKDTLKMRGNNP